MPEAKVAAIADFRTQEGFTEREKAALALAEAITRSGGEIDDSVWNACAAFFDDGKMIELIATIGTFNALNRMANSMRVEITK